MGGEEVLLEFLVFDLGGVERREGEEIAVDDDRLDVRRQLPEVLWTDLILGRRDEVSEDTHPRRKVDSVVDAVEEHPVEQERFRSVRMGGRKARSQRPPGSRHSRWRSAPRATAPTRNPGRCCRRG